MKKILFVATGGTIASKKTENGLTPQITPEELISYIPEVEKICEITAVQPFNLDSSNVVPENWSMLVKVIREHYDAFDGWHRYDGLYGGCTFQYDSEFAEAHCHHRCTASDQSGYYRCQNKSFGQLLLCL